MKLFINTAGLCIIPKLVNAAETQLTKWMTPDTLTNAQLEHNAKIAAENLEATRIAADEPLEYTINVDLANPRQELHDAHVQLYDAHVLAKLDADSIKSTGPMDLPTPEYAPKVDKDGVINPQAIKAGIVQGQGSTIQEANMGKRFNKTKKLGNRTPTIRKKRDSTKITQDDWDFANKIWANMVAENCAHPEWTIHEQYNHSHLTKIFNKERGFSKAVKSIGRLVNDPKYASHKPRIACPPYEEEVIGSVSLNP